MRRDDTGATNARSRAVMRRLRRRLRRGRMIPMCGLIPKRPTGDHADVAVKAGLKRRHHIRPRYFGGEARWDQSAWKRANGVTGQWGDYSQ